MQVHHERTRGRVHPGRVRERPPCRDLGQHGVGACHPLGVVHLRRIRDFEEPGTQGLELDHGSAAPLAVPAVFDDDRLPTGCLAAEGVSLLTRSNSARVLGGRHGGGHLVRVQLLGLRRRRRARRGGQQHGQSDGRGYRSPGGTSSQPSRTARIASSVRDATPRRSNSRARWVSTVFAPICRADPISSFVRPSATSRTTSCSRGERRDRDRPSSGGPRRPARPRPHAGSRRPARGVARS